MVVGLMPRKKEVKAVLPSSFKDVVNLVQGRYLREKLVKLVERPVVRIGGKVYTGLPLEASPAAKGFHHSYDRGLVDHVVASSKLALTLCDMVETIYGGRVNRDIVLSAIILHDIFKPLSYVKRGDGLYTMSDLAQRVDHHTLISAELINRGFPLDVVHSVLSAHGKYGPMMPRTIEGLITHLADITDSSLVGEVHKAAQYHVRNCLGREAGRLTAKEAFNIVYMKQYYGCDGVRKAFEGVEEERLT